MKLLYHIPFLLILVQPAIATDLIRFSGKVISITDGDTITVLHDKKPVRIRLYGIDCPERRQAFGERAKRATSNLVYSKIVIVTPKHFDIYGRLIASVRLADGRVLERELLKMGLAWWYSRYSPNDFGLEELEKRARELRIGLWIDENPIPPWDYRKGVRYVEN